MGRAVARQDPRRQAHDKPLTLGYAGSERATRRAVPAVKKDYRSGRRRVHPPWVTELGMWLQYDLIAASDQVGSWLGWSLKGLASRARIHP